MTEYRFHLQKYQRGSKINCPNCGRKNCFTRYIDISGSINFPPNVGKCDHINSCGYHYSPRDFFSDNTVNNINYTMNDTCSQNSKKATEAMMPSLISRDIFVKSMKRYDINPLYKFMVSIMGTKETNRLFEMYNVGTSYKWGGSTVYWQFDSKGGIRAGKIILYDKNNGHRIKEPRSYVTWVHAELKIADYILKQCFFGEHLLSVNSSSVVMVVESEKTAIICKYFMPDFIWIATGGINSCLKEEYLNVLHDRKVVLMPDLGATEKWKSLMPMLNGICCSVSISSLLEETATDEQRRAGLDIADFLLSQNSKNMILHEMIQKNQSLQKLIDTFDLTIIPDE